MRCVNRLNLAFNISLIYEFMEWNLIQKVGTNRFVLQQVFDK